jgi:hypothetical protein
VNSCDGYQQFAVKCVELARRMDSPRDRSAMLEMALIWSRLAEYAAKTAARKECTEFVSPRSTAKRTRHWVKIKNPNAPAVRREAEEDWGR